MNKSDEYLFLHIYIFILFLYVFFFVFFLHISLNKCSTILEEIMRGAHQLDKYADNQLWFMFHHLFVDIMTNFLRFGLEMSKPVLVLISPYFQAVFLEP